MTQNDIKNAGLKVTAPRKKILDILENACKRHLSAEDIYKLLLDSGEEVGLATVYRVLTQFESAGLIIKHNFEGDRSVYELDQGDHHDHLVCVACGLIEEFLDPLIEKRQEEIANQNGFNIVDHSLSIYGLCKKCQKTDNS